MTKTLAAIAALMTMYLPFDAVSAEAPSAAAPSTEAPSTATPSTEAPSTEPPSTAPARPPVPLVALYERVAPAVVRVHTRAGAGAGFLIAPDRIATAWHVADTRHDLRVETADGTLIAAELVTRDRKRDLAILAIPEPLSVNGVLVSPLPLAPAPPPVGTPVAAIGHPLSPSKDRTTGPLVGLLRWSLTEGIVSQVGEASVQTTATVQPGNSGGPLLNLAGEVVGVVTLRVGGLGAATRADHLEALRTAEPSVPTGPTVELHGRYGLGATRLPGADARTGTFITLSTGLEVILDRKLMIGFAMDVDLLASKTARTEDNLRSTRLMLAAQIGPRFELPFHPKANVPFAIQPYFTAGVSMARQGEHASTLRLTDPSCDPLAEDCAFEANSTTNWSPRRWAQAVGGGVRLDLGTMYFDTQVTTNPAGAEQDTRLQFGFGVRF